MLIYLTAITFLLAGYFLGRVKTDTAYPSEIKRTLTKTLRQVAKKEPPGAIDPLTPEQLLDLENPALREEKEEMRKVFDRYNL